MTMGERIRERRKAMNLTQEELAQKLGMQKSAIAKYESGRVTNLKRSVIAKLSVILDCRPTYLMGIEDDIPEEPVYYTNPETAEIAQRLYDDEHLRILFDAARDARPEDLLLAAEMLKRFKGDHNE